jgi:transposase
MRFVELTDEQWVLIGPHLPPPAHTGRPRNDDRKTVNGILYVLTTGCRWMDMPDGYGSHKSVWERHKKWSEDGTWKLVMDSLVAKGYAEGTVKVDSLSIDSSTVPAKKGERRWASTVTRRSRGPRSTPS